jgi:hypothetical protein
MSNKAITATPEYISRGGLPHYPAEMSAIDRIEHCVNHELYYGGNARAVAEAIARDMRQGYIAIGEEKQA